MRRLSLFTLAFLLSLPLGAVPETQKMTADQLMARVRYSSANQKEQKLDGTLSGPKIKKIPFGMEIKGKKIYFSFSDDDKKTWKTFELRLNQRGQELYTYENNKGTRFGANRYTENIAGTSITYEDLSLRFLYWPNGTIHQQSQAAVVKGRKCHIVDLPNPDQKIGAYGTIRVWIDQENGAFWQIHAFSKEGKLLKTFNIDEIMKTDDTWFFKRMIVKVMNPDNPKKAIATNYIDLKKD